MMRGIIHKLEDQRGAAAVEFAIILPLLLVFLFGIIEFSIMFYDKAVITNASREGARAGIVFDNPRISATQIQSVVQDYAENRLITFGTPDLQIPSPTICSASGDELVVTVSYNYEFLIIPGLLTSFFSGGAFGEDTTMEARTIMRCE